MGRTILDGPLAKAISKTDAQKRKEVGLRSSLKTKYQPVNDWIMIIPLAEMVQKGKIIIPNVAVREIFEGHIVALGPDVDKTRWTVGDCISWEHNAEFRMTLDEEDKFALVRPMNILMRIPASELQ